MTARVEKHPVLWMCSLIKPIKFAKMKKIVLFCIALLLGIPTFAGIVINGTFNIGKKTQNCDGFGICSATTSSKGFTDGAINGTIDFDQERGSIILTINANDIQKVQPEKVKYFSNKTELTFEEEFTFPDEFKAEAKASQPLKIKKGTYSVSYKNGKYIIEIPF